VPNGCNLLIKKGKARLLENADDIAAALKWDNEQTSSPDLLREKLLANLNENEKIIVNILQNVDDMTIDKITFESRLQISSILLNLEFKGLIKNLPGKRYMLC